MRLLRLLDVSNKYSFKCHYTHIKLAFSVGLTDWLLTCVAQRTGTAERTDSANTFLGQLIKLSGQRRRRNKTHLYQMVLLIRLLVLIWWSLAMPLCVLRCPLGVGQHNRSLVSLGPARCCVCVFTFWVGFRKINVGLLICRLNVSNSRQN